MSPSPQEPSGAVGGVPAASCHQWLWGGNTCPLTPKEWLSVLGGGGPGGVWGVCPPPWDPLSWSCSAGGARGGDSGGHGVDGSILGTHLQRKGREKGFGEGGGENLRVGRGCVA